MITGTCCYQELRYGSRLRDYRQLIPSICRAISMLRVEEAMTLEVATLLPDVMAAKAQETLDERDVRRLPAIEEGERLFGLRRSQPKRRESAPRRWRRTAEPRRPGLLHPAYTHQVEA